MYCMEYVIRQGDTLYSLSRQFNIPIDEIMRANPLVNVYRLEVGTTLCIPVSTPQGNYTNFTTYLVQEGDSLGSVLSSDSFNIEELMQLNDPNDIMLLPGSTINLPITGTGEGGVTL